MPRGCPYRSFNTRGGNGALGGRGGGVILLNAHDRFIMSEGSRVIAHGAAGAKGNHFVRFRECFPAATFPSI